jgi:hypothetical protein
MLWSPTIRAAMLADTPWLDVFCPGCNTTEQSTFAPSIAIQLPRSARWCSACAARGVQGRRRENCHDSIGGCGRVDFNKIVTLCSIMDGCSLNAVATPGCNGNR